MQFVDALNTLIARGVTSELIATTDKHGESIVILTDGLKPTISATAHAAYGVTPGGVIEGYWLVDESGVVIYWDAQPDVAMNVGIGKLHFNNTGFLAMNNRLEARLNAAT